MKTGIYKITSPYGQVYIGQSVDIEKRFMQHRRNNTKGHSKLKSSFNYHGSYNHVFEIIEECNFDDLNEREMYWFNYYSNNGYDMLNLLKIPSGTKKIRARKTIWKVIPGCSNYSISSTGIIEKHARKLKYSWRNAMILDFKIDKNNNVCVRLKTDEGIGKDFIVDEIIADVFLEKENTYYKIVPDWESRCSWCKKKFNNRVDQFVRKDIYDRMTLKPVIYKTVRT